MKTGWLVLISTFLWLILSLLSGCQHHAQDVQVPESITAKAPAEPRQGLRGPVVIAKNPLPKISFERTVCDLGKVGRSTNNTCEFKFTNIGRAPLKITNVKRTCGCTVFKLDKTDFAPGQAGTIKVTYTADRSTTTTQKHIYVSTNDKDNPRVTLTIKAKIVQMVEAAPARLNLSLRERNAGMPDITLKSRDGQPFSIKSFASTNCNCIAADIDPNVSASRFVFHPKADIEKLKESPKGLIEIRLTHPQCRSVRIPFELLTEFKTVPVRIIIPDVRPQQAVTRQVTVVSNYGEDFEVESTSSRNGHIKVLSQEKLEKTYKLKLQVTPPPADNRGFFSDTLYIDIKGKEKLAVNCRGFYLKPTASRSRQADKRPAKFRAEPQVVKVRDTEPGRAVTAEVLVLGNDNEDFQIVSASSQKGTVELLDRKKLGDGYKLKLRITPPPSKYRLEVFSDVLYVSIKTSEEGGETTKLPITCRGTYSRPRPK